MDESRNSKCRSFVIGKTGFGTGIADFVASSLNARPRGQSLFGRATHPATAHTTRRTK
jgi:hypothetical protein